MNLPYALALLNNIITQFIEQDKDFFKDKKEEFFELFSTHFKDLCYNCLLILKQADPPLDQDEKQYQNQSGVSTGRIINVFNVVHCKYVAHF